jgi:hypothetical protein
VYGSDGRHAGTGLTYSAFVRWVLLSSSFRCLGICLSVSSSYLAANVSVVEKVGEQMTTSLSHVKLVIKIEKET